MQCSDPGVCPCPDCFEQPHGSSVGGWLGPISHVEARVAVFRRESRRATGTGLLPHLRSLHEDLVDLSASSGAAPQASYSAWWPPTIMWDPAPVDRPLPRFTVPQHFFEPDSPPDLTGGSLPIPDFLPEQGFPPCGSHVRS